MCFSSIYTQILSARTEKLAQFYNLLALKLLVNNKIDRQTEWLCNWDEIKSIF